MKVRLVFHRFTKKKIQQKNEESVFDTRRTQRKVCTVRIQPKIVFIINNMPNRILFYFLVRSTNIIIIFAIVFLALPFRSRVSAFNSISTFVATVARDGAFYFLSLSTVGIWYCVYSLRLIMATEQQ